MNKTIITTGILVASLVTMQPTYAQGSVQHFSQAVKNSGQAVGHSVAGGVKLSAGVVAAPLAIGAGIGKMSGAASRELLDIANQPIGTPLPVTEENITAGPVPGKAIQTREERE